jgi:hypothetical protein
MILDAITSHRSFNLLHFDSMYKVDVFVPSLTSAATERFRRRVSHIVKEATGDSAYFSTAEDTILAKLDWYQLGHRVSERQWTDIVDVLTIQTGKLDLVYMRLWAAQSGVADLLERAIEEAAATP